MSVLGEAQLPVQGCAPVVKWAGGKRQLLGELLARLPADVDHRRHVELFTGGGALFFARAPERALLADTCEPLMRMYAVVRKDPRRVVRCLHELSKRHSEPHYYRVRDRFNARRVRGKRPEGAEEAAMMLYLNRAGFNGLYRCNRDGHFNVPFGRRTAKSIYQPELVYGAAPVLARADLHIGPFDTVGGVNILRDDFVYLDPPYVPLGCGSPSFTSYGPGGFSHEEHIRLRDAAEVWASRGAKVMISNSDTPFTRDIWRRWRIETVRARRSVAATKAGREAVREVVIRSYGDAT
jgi:DNA adenine methylase